MTDTDPRCPYCGIQVSKQGYCAKCKLRFDDAYVTRKELADNSEKLFGRKYSESGIRQWANKFGFPDPVGKTPGKKGRNLYSLRAVVRWYPEYLK